MTVPAQRGNPRTADEQALADAMASALGYDLTSSGQEVGVPWARLVECGWTPQVYPRLAALGRHGLAVDAWCVSSRMGSGLDRTSEASALFAMVRLVVLAEITAQGGALLQEAEPWLRLAVSATDDGDGHFLHDALVQWGHEGARSFLPALTGRLGTVAPLVFAAGLDLQEVPTFEEAGSMAPETLTGLAVLRGYRFPS